MTDIKNLILRSGAAKAEHPMKHYRCTIADLEQFAIAIRNEALLNAAEKLKNSPIKWTVLGPEAIIKQMVKENNERHS
jgi:hypothetical protein